MPALPDASRHCLCRFLELSKDVLFNTWCVVRHQLQLGTWPWAAPQNHDSRPPLDTCVWLLCSRGPSSFFPPKALRAPPVSPLTARSAHERIWQMICSRNPKAFPRSTPPSTLIEPTWLLCGPKSSLCGYETAFVRHCFCAALPNTARNFMPPCEILCGCSWQRHDLWWHAVSCNFDFCGYECVGKMSYTPEKIQ